MYVITKTIKQGRKDQLAVKQLQALLNFLGERLIVDGDFGAKSTKAVKNFQTSQGLSPDGVIGQKSWFKLYEVSQHEAQSLIDTENIYDELVLDSKNRELLLWVQSILYLIDNKTVTSGSFDANLERTVISFQAQNECTESGCIDFEMWQKLFEKALEEIAH